MYSKETRNKAQTVFAELFSYCQASHWAGYDPYDALNSAFFEALPLLDSKPARLVATQILKRSPLNLRALLRIPKKQNAKAIALFLSAFLKAPDTLLPERKVLADEMIRCLVGLRSPGVLYWCWGYSFPWQTRREVVPAGTANLVCTTFVGNALLDAYEQTHEESCLEMAASAAAYIVDRLFWSEGHSVSSFSYPLPGMRSTVHNANFLAAALLVRVAKTTGEERFLEPALAAARYSTAKQREDGSWAYGEGPAQGWIDNFHTGFNLGALLAIGRSLATTEFDAALRRGLLFYRSRFFREDGAPRYFADRTYPIDIHCAAQGIITLTEMKHLDPEGLVMAERLVRWTIANMWSDRGFFYYRLLRLATIRTPYMRWSEAWMLLALVVWLRDGAFETEENSETVSSLATMVHGAT